MNKTRGFTLVELSIALVIIGIIIGGVLTGQQVIQSARITNAVNAIQAYQAQMQAYMQNYNALPGDDDNAAERFASLSVGQCSDSNCGDGAIGTNASFDADSEATGTAAESRLFWAHLRAANLVKNKMSGKSTAVQPANPFGGIYGVQNGTADGVFETTVLCLDKLPATAAQGIDSRLDDGVRNGGLMQAIAGGEEGDKSYNEGETYTLCIRM